MNNLAPNSGAVYVFSRTDGVWSQQAYLKSSNTDIGDSLGSHSIAIDGDTVVVGSIFESSSATGVDGDQMDNSAGNAGAAYVFTRTGGVWSQQAYLKASNTDAEDSFGYAIALSGETIVIGAPDEASNATGSGGVVTKLTIHRQCCRSSLHVFGYARWQSAATTSVFKASILNDGRYQVRLYLWPGISVGRGWPGDCCWCIR